MMTFFPWDETGRVLGETFIFPGEEGIVKPAFGLKALHRVEQQESGTLFEEGKDYAVDYAAGTIRRLKGGRMPFIAPEQLYPDPKTAIFHPDPKANAIGNAPGSPTGCVLFAGGDYFLQHAVSITYTAKEPLPTLSPESGKLPRLAERACKQELLKVAFIGDSITHGLNASGRIGVPPYLPPYPGRIAAWLAERTPSIFANCAVSGKSSAQGLEHFAEVLNRMTPDLLFIAYGMNELGSAPEDFAQRISDIIAKAREANPEMEFVLISPMRKNREWGTTPPDAARAFEAALAKIAEGQPDIALAPVNRIWCEVEDRKCFLDLTGNGVNHPNDFGHSLYTWVIAKVLEKALNP